MKGKNHYLATPKYLPSMFSNKDEFLTPFDSVFDSLMNTSFPDFGKEFGIDFFEKGSYPKCDIIDHSDKVSIELEIPGVKKEDITIETKPVDGDTQLIISGKKSKDEEKSKDCKDVKYLRRELKKSSFRRSFVLHKKMNDEEINAEFKDGILTIDIPKKESNEIEEDVKKIQIK